MQHSGHGLGPEIEFSLNETCEQFKEEETFNVSDNKRNFSWNCLMTFTSYTAIEKVSSGT